MSSTRSSAGLGDLDLEHFDDLTVFDEFDVDAPRARPEGAYNERLRIGILPKPANDLIVDQDRRMLDSRRSAPSLTLGRLAGRFLEGPANPTAVDFDTERMAVARGPYRQPE